jgi:ribose/xylose/arabinose/galactoside ABC-type transport system permease subunit
MNFRQTTEPESKKQKISIFRRFENSTVITVLISFIIAITTIQFTTGMLTGDFSIPTFITPNNVFNILMQISVAGILAIGMTVVMVSRGIDLSVGMLVSLITILMAKSVTDWGLSLPVTLLLGLTVSVLLETILGYIISRTHVEPFIITLGGMIMFQGIALLLCGSREVRLANGEFDFLKFNIIAGAKFDGLNLIIPIYVIIFVIVAAIIWAIMKFTRYGRWIYCVGSNPEAAYLSGINVKNVKMSVYSLNGVMVFLAAAALNSRLGVALISGGTGLEIDAIAAVVIGGVAMSGGKGNAWGAFFGAILLGCIGNAMSMLRLPGEWQYIIKGLVIILSIIAGTITNFISKKIKHKVQIS